MRICFISNPNNTHTRRWVGWFARRGHAVSVIGDTRLEIPWPEVEIFDLTRRMKTTPIKYLFWAARTRQIARDWQADILHAHRVSSAGWVGAFSGLQPFVLTPWGSDLYLHPKRSIAARLLALFTLRRARLVTADAEDLRSLAIRYGAPAARTHLIQWGVNVKLFSPADGASNPLRQALDLGEGPVILSIRAPTPLYNLHTLLEAAPTVLKQIPAARFVLRDYNGDPQYTARLKLQIERMGITFAVRWLERLEPWERNVDGYRLADVAVSVPSSDSTPVSVLEALACGVPVVASDLPALREWITPGEQGLLVPPGQAQPLAQAILTLLQNPTLRARMGQQGRALVAERANHDAEMIKMESLYQSLLV